MPYRSPLVLDRDGHIRNLALVKELLVEELRAYLGHMRRYGVDVARGKTFAQCHAQLVKLDRLIVYPSMQGPPLQTTRRYMWSERALSFQTYRS